MTIFQNNLPNVLSPRDLVFRPGLSDINWTIIISSFFLNASAGYMSDLVNCIWDLIWEASPGTVWLSN